MVELISAIIEARRASGRSGEDFLQTLMEARYKSGRGLTHHEIAGLLLTTECMITELPEKKEAAGGGHGHPPGGGMDY